VFHDKTPIVTEVAKLRKINDPRSSSEWQN